MTCITSRLLFLYFQQTIVGIVGIVGIKQLLELLELIVEQLIEQLLELNSFFFMK